MAEERLGASFSIDTTNLKAGLSQANKLIRESESEFKAAAAGLDDWSHSETGLTAKIKQLSQTTDIQKKKVNALQSEYDRLVSEGLDPTSEAAIKLRTQINNEKAALAANEKQLSQTQKALDDFAESAEDAGNKTKEMGDSSEGASKGLGAIKKIGGGVVTAITAISGACVAAVGAFLSLAESTRETRTMMSKLETQFTTAGHSAETAKETYSTLYGVLGDTGKASEASAFLAELGDNQEELTEWTDALTGVYAKWGDSLPVEGLAEAALHTSELGTVQGNLSDALEWSGVSVDDFNAHLAACSDEQERQELIVSTLNGLYGEQAKSYKEVNKDVIEAQEAQENLNLALADLGAIAEPILTTLKNLATELLTSIKPFVEVMGEGLSGAMEGTAGAADKLAEGLTGIITTAIDKIVTMLPFLIDTIVSITPQLLTALLGQLPLIIQTLLTGIAQIATALGAMLPTLVPVIVNAVIMITETLLDNVDLIIDAGIALLIGLADGLIAALPQLVAKIPVIIEKLISALTRNLPKIASAGIQITIKLAEGIVKSIPQLVSKIPQIITSIIKGLKDGLSGIKDVGKDLIEGLWNGISDMTGWIGKKIKGFGESVLGGLKNFFGIASPSKVMANVVGKNLALGIGKGFTDNIGNVNDEITDAMNITTKTGTTKGGVIVYQTNNYSQAHSRLELYKSKQATSAAVRLALGGA